MQTGLEAGISSNEYKPLPPIQELALSQTQKSKLNSIIKQEFQLPTFKILTLCCQTRALVAESYVLGAKRSRHSQSLLVLAEHKEKLVLAEIQFFIECVAVHSDLFQLGTLWVACLDLYLEHPCKVWYGNPVQVWSTVFSPDTFFVPVKNIKSRVIYAQCRKNFGTMLVNDHVYVVTPLSLATVFVAVKISSHV